ncbi:hypothetical protein MLD38_003491 [Melastoma candidum]|uniref:Uncharacterized protein n=1 Tax=Melastoma candidum TaxID=119954 RepID=A0ACB9S2V7_9MYRT|nr:hypothetical protein MLD38_003491 [Melastoma candidum]
MDVHGNPVLGGSGAYFFNSKDDNEELRHSLLRLTLELETMRAAAREDIRRRDEEILRLRLLHEKAVKEKEEALEKSHKLLLENLLLTHRHQQRQGQGQGHGTKQFVQASEVEDEPPLPSDDDNNHGFPSRSSSESNGSIVSSTGSAFLELVPEKQLPEKGKLLQAVVNAGPLLRTLLLAGPLPQWRNPPPPLEPFNISPLSIPSLHSYHSSPMRLYQAPFAGKGGPRTGETTPAW